MPILMASKYFGFEFCNFKTSACSRNLSLTLSLSRSFSFPKWLSDGKRANCCASLVHQYSTKKKSTERAETHANNSVYLVFIVHFRSIPFGNVFTFRIRFKLFLLLFIFFFFLVSVFPLMRN